jgi:hypothetical protein
MNVTLQIQPKVTCPSCWTKSDPASLLWVATHTTLLGDPYLGPAVPSRFPASRFDHEGFAIDAGGDRCEALACPKCHLKVPRVLVEFKPVVISVIGAPGSGKSYFLASAVWNTRKRAQQLRLNFSDADPAANEILSDYEQKLFLNDRPEALVAIKKTQEGGELYQKVVFGEADSTVFYARPFVFAVRPRMSHPYVHHDDDARLQSRALCLYDNAGEHFLPTLSSEREPATDHLAHSEVLVFVFDPLNHPQLRTRCRHYSSDPGLFFEKIHRQDSVLLEAAKRVRTKANIANHGPLGRPLVVAVNKCDVWQSEIGADIRAINPYRTLPDSVVGLHVPTIRDVSDKIRSMLVNVAPEFLAACDEVSDDVTFVPVSPQGCSPEKASHDQIGVRPGRLHPIWPEVPLVYALSKSKCKLVPAIGLAPQSDGNSKGQQK